MKTIAIWLWLASICLAGVDDSLVQIRDGDAIGCGVVVRRWPNEKNDSKPPRILVLIATAEHVANKESNEILVQFPDFSDSRGTFLSSDKDHDQSLILAWGPDAVPEAEVATEAPREGDPVELHAVHHANVIDDLLWPCRVTKAKATSVSNAKVIMMDGFAYPGDSGVGGVNASGQIVGIVSGGWKPFNAAGQPIRIWPIQGGGIEPLRKLLDNLPKRE